MFCTFADKSGQEAPHLPRLRVVAREPRQYVSKTCQHLVQRTLPIQDGRGGGLGVRERRGEGVGEALGGGGLLGVLFLFLRLLRG